MGTPIAVQQCPSAAMADHGNVLLFGSLRQELLVCTNNPRLGIGRGFLAWHTVRVYTV